MTSETVDRVEMAEALRILQKLKDERLSHVRKLDPCERYEFLFGTYEVTWQQDEQGRSGKCVRFTDCLHILCDLKICGRHLTGWSTDAQFRDGEEAWRFFSQDWQQHLAASFRPNGTGRPDAVSPPSAARQIPPRWNRRCPFSGRRSNSAGRVLRPGPAE